MRRSDPKSDCVPTPAPDVLVRRLWQLLRDGRFDEARDYHLDHRRAFYDLQCATLSPETWPDVPALLGRSQEHAELWSYHPLFRALAAAQSPTSVAGALQLVTVMAKALRVRLQEPPNDDHGARTRLIKTRKAELGPGEITAADAVRRFDISRSTLRDAQNAGQLTWRKDEFSNQVIYRISEIEQVAARRTASA